ncbi:hypothetical protein QBC40DRAFT_1865 [Triangularia verruculosa]|uniref:CFEM domain-containing protein n=1 Tax=Triangularia verruculosa TaxID=2587418 RepID=A0AAN6XU40_9PEZI|nr:hypothetical protein QBC40DRAFT_1865 [Triangularia verruculosa]
MKSFAAFVLAFGTASVVAQFPEGFPQCGITCVNNMLDKAGSEFPKCSRNDAACLCNVTDFRWGINDCARQSCNGSEEANRVIQYGITYCAGASAPTDIPPSVTEAANTPTGSVTASPTASDGNATTTGTESSDVGDATPVSTVTWTSTIGSEGNETTVTGTTTLLGVSGIPGATSVPETTITSDLLTTISEESTTFTSTIGQTTLTSSLTGSALTSALESQATEASSAAESSTSSAWGAQITAPPALGFLAAAGIAAALL